jgi:hypothetical protein
VTSSQSAASFLYHNTINIVILADSWKVQPVPHS